MVLRTLFSAVLLAVTVTPAAAEARRADLTVSSGALRLADGTLSGSLSVHARGRSVGRTSVSIGVRVNRQRVVFSRSSVPALRRGSTRRLTVRGRLPDGLPIGLRAITACADAGHRVRESSERNNCRRVATLRITAKPGSSSAPGIPGPPSSPSTPVPPPPVDTTLSTVPTEPLAVQKNQVVPLQSNASPYWVYVPSSYDATHTTPMSLLVFLHGCQGRSPERIVDASPGGDQSWVTIAPGGREGGCWDANTDSAVVLAAIADIKRRLNIAPRRVVIGGFSSGGDLAYRMAYDNANLFAGVLAEGTTPFRDTGCPSAAACIARAAWRFNIVHLAHLSDEYYDIGTVREETDALSAAGFPMTRIERRGTHSEPDSGDKGTVHDLRTYLLPHMNDPWLAPAR